MTKLVWDQVDERLYETGIDRGVLYLKDGTAVAWNGLTAVEENVRDETASSYYYDGIKYLTVPSFSDFAATLKAITYPDEFLECEGIVEENGLLIDGQRPKIFHLVYRTKVGSGVLGDLFGYKIHILYNVTAIPSSKEYSSISSDTSPLDFSWSITTVPEDLPNYRNTAHIVFDTSELPDLFIEELENILYGADSGITLIDGGPVTLSDYENLDGGSALGSGTELIDGNASILGLVPNVPPLAELVDWADRWARLQITDNGDGTWTAQDHGEYITMTSATSFEIDAENAVVLDANTYTITDTD